MPIISQNSESIQEIISQIPSWIVRWGTTVFFLILIALFSLSWVIHYPDIIKAPLFITTQQIPKSVISHATGRLEKLFIKDKQQVKKGEVLGIIESTTNYQEVLSLSVYLDNCANQLTHNKFSIVLEALPNHINLGDLQNDFENFELNRMQVRAFLDNGYYYSREKLLKKDLVDLEKLSDNLLLQKKIFEEDYSIAKNEYDVNKKLYEQKVIPSLEFKKIESKLLLKELSVRQVESSIINNITSINSKRGELLEIKRTFVDNNINLLQSLNLLRNRIKTWKNKYFLVAPQDGNVSFTSVIQDNIQINENQAVFKVGDNNQKIFGIVQISQFSAGKVKIGQEVNIKFSGYPFQEYGMIQGEIISISDISSSDSTFFARISLPQNLSTNYGKKIIFKNGMNAIAEIITDDSRLIERYIYQLRKIFER